MANIFNLDNDSDFSEKINIDDLYERKRQTDLNQLALFQKILNRVHVRIKTTSRIKKDEKHCWFIVPETIIGVPRYDHANCIAYLLDKLQDNGFNVKYIHPNALFISWHHWVPSYIRTELKKKTGLTIDEYGNKIGDDNENEKQFSSTVKEKEQNAINLKSPTTASQQNQKKYTPINSYKPSGGLIYNQDILDKLENKFT